MSEQHRRECEARDWLRRGYTDAHSVDGLMRKIVAKRGYAASEILRAEMREQWARRSEWLS